MKIRYDKRIEGKIMKSTAEIISELALSLSLYTDDN